jgi:hypothetical protein
VVSHQLVGSPIISHGTCIVCPKDKREPKIDENTRVVGGGLIFSISSASLGAFIVLNGTSVCDQRSIMFATTSVAVFMAGNDMAKDLANKVIVS